MARTPPAKMSYPCNECSFEAQSARQLSRHKAVTHVENALKCVLCPFVTVRHSIRFIILKESIVC